MDTGLMGSPTVKKTGWYRRRYSEYFFRMLRIMRFKFFTYIALLRLRFHGAEVGPGLLVTGWLKLYLLPSSLVKIGCNVVIRSGHSDNVVGAYIPTAFFVGNGGTLIIEDGAGISNSVIVAYERIRIGTAVMVGGGCRIYDSDFHSLDVRTRISCEGQIKTKAIEIDSSAFVGGHSIILKGTRIGEKAIIGAGSVVTSIVQAGEVWAGNPARKIR